MRMSGQIPVWERLWPKPGRFRITYFQDCGYAAIGCIVELDAASAMDAAEKYPDEVRKQGFACTAQGIGDILEFERVVPPSPQTGGIKEKP